MIDSNVCNGCECCVNICPTKAISMVQNLKGFYVATIDLKKCINCGVCESYCSNINLEKNKIDRVFACINKNKEIVKNSSSGGVFLALANNIIEQGGAVSGVEYDDNFTAIHTITYDLEYAKRYCGSKYVQSKNSIYNDIKNKLENGETVLFTGTPCQVAGIKNFTKNFSTDKLYTVEVLCHGVGSPKLFLNHLSRFKNKIYHINFREKDKNYPCISFKFKNKKKIIPFNLDHYANGFNRCLFLNDVCFNCKFAGENRVADITIGDFWKGPDSSEILPNDLEYPKGMSLVTINSNKGYELWNLCNKDLYFIESSLEKAKSGNRTLKQPSNKNKRYDSFWKCYTMFGYNIATSIYCANIIYNVWFRIKMFLRRIRRK